jgi:hypothetical protein
MAPRKSSRKYGKSASKSVEHALRLKKRGKLRSEKGGKGGVLKSREQAIAIGLSEARKRGAKVPEKRSSGSLPHCVITDLNSYRVRRSSPEIPTPEIV